MQATAQTSGDLSGPSTQSMSTSLLTTNPSGGLFGAPIEPKQMEATAQTSSSLFGPNPESMSTSTLTINPSGGLFGALIGPK
jgi:hypothetical protein